MHDPLSIPPRSPLLVRTSESILVVVDIQERLAPKIHDFDKMLGSTVKLLKASRELGIPMLASEQYPEKLGATLEALIEYLPVRESKRMFSCRELLGVWENRIDPVRKTLIVCGIESHVCILQTVLDFLSLGWNVVVPVDAISSQRELDHQIAIQRMASSGACMTTSESLIFEWAETSLDPNFRNLSAIVKG